MEVYGWLNSSSLTPNRLKFIFRFLLFTVYTFKTKNNSGNAAKELLKCEKEGHRQQFLRNISIEFLGNAVKELFSVAQSALLRRPRNKVAHKSCTGKHI